MRIGEFAGLQWQDIDFERKVINIRRSMMTGYVDGKKIMELVAPKTVNSYRAIPFFGETGDCFKSWRKKQDYYREKCGNRWRANPEHGNLVFTTTFGSPVTRYVIVHDIKRIVDNLNARNRYEAIAQGKMPVEFKKVHPHAFRHTFCTRCLEKGLDPVFVQRIMGHSKYDTTLSYSHVLDELTAKEVEKAGFFLDKEFA